ncbi:hypothetical protein EIQ30_17205 [Xanthomonas campestris]
MTVDATIVGAPRSTKKPDKACHPQIHQTCKSVLVVRVRRRHRGSMRQPDPANHADVQLHIEVPLHVLDDLLHWNE